MRVVLQRVTSASVTIDGVVHGAIERGLLILVGVAKGDTEQDGAWLASKLCAMRLFSDESGRPSLDLKTAGGRLLVVSQFTLLASTRKGTRPSWDAAPPDVAIPLYETFLKQLEAITGEPPQRGVFGADMQVALVNDGPVTLIIDSKTRE